ncbi:MAG: hypothetical protein IJ871_07700 [Ruminococcus sp.]|nr:hypothetical protein [Ruminococcus sp.]
MPVIDIRETGLNSTDPTLVNQNYKLYSRYNDDAAKYRYPLPEGGARPEGVHDAAYYFDQLIRHLNDAAARAKEMDDDKIGVTFNHVHNFNLANEFVLRDIDRVLSLETAPDAPENKERMEFVRKLREPVVLNMDASVKLKRKLEADLEQELFGESMKVFNETNPFDRDNFDLFIGEKYLDPSVRIRKAHDMPFSVDRSAVLSISVLALINEGMDFETVSDPKKGIERKQAMFDKYSQLIAKGGEDAQNQIAQTLYTGYKNLTKMINDAAVTIDFSQPDLLQNKRYCQLLHLHAVQHDAWQELKHVQNKVVDLAKADDPQIDTYHKLTDHFKDMQSPLLGVRSELMNYREGCKFLACNRELGSAVGQISKSISDYVYSKKTEEMIAQAQARNANTGKPFLQWFTEEEMMYDAFKGPIDPPLAEKLDKYKIVKSAELAHPLAKLISSGEFTKNIRIEGDVSANPQVTGLPSANDIQTMLLNNAKGDEFDDILAGIYIAETRFEPRTQMEKNAVKYMNESENKFEGLVKACADADAAVHRSSGEFKDAAKALKALDKAMKAYNEDDDLENRIEAAEKLAKLREDAEEKIQKYLDRKEKNKPRNKDYEQKTLDRIDLMKLSLSTVQEFRYDLDNMQLGFDKELAENETAAMKEADNKYKEQAETYSNKLGEQAESENIKGKRDLYEKAKESYDDLRKLAKNSPDRNYSEKQQRMILRMMATVTHHEMLCDFKTGEIKDKYVDNPDLPYKTTYNRVRHSSEFEEATKDMFNSEGQINQERLKDFIAQPKMFRDKIMAQRMSAVKNKQLKEKELNSSTTHNKNNNKKLNTALKNNK